MLPEDILDMILSYHRPVCAEVFIGNPNYTLYWCYDRRALRQILGMTNNEYRMVKSRLGEFLKRNPETNAWIANMPWLGKKPRHPQPRSLSSFIPRLTRDSN